MSEPIVVVLPMDLSWKYASGDAMGRLLAGLAERRLAALRCEGCGRRYLPPRAFCGNCRTRLGTWVPVHDEGTLEAWTVVHLPILDGRTGQPRSVPYGMGLVRLDGADTTINCFLSVADPSALRIGQRVRAVWRSERIGALDDIACFEPAPEGASRADDRDSLPGSGPAAVVRQSEVRLSFRYAAGEAASRFLVALRDEQTILGSRCASCARVVCPARSFCARCGSATSETVRVGPGGQVVTWTDVPGRGTLGMIRLDGADTPLTHRLLGSEWHVGARVVARFARARTGSIADIEGFAKREEATR
jgi:uncharacterized OB-fold protein